MRHSAGVQGGGVVGGAYQDVDGAAHAVLGTLVVRDGAVGQQVLQLAAEQQRQLLPRLRQVPVAPAVLQQAAADAQNTHKRTITALIESRLD